MFVHVVYEMLCTWWYIKCCANISYAVLSIDGAMYMMDVQCYVHMMCACWICSVVYVGCYVHVVYPVLCTYGVVCMLYNW